MAQVSLEHAAAYYRIELPEIRRIGNEVRCAVLSTAAGKMKPGIGLWRFSRIIRRRSGCCHEAGCGRGGNLVSLCDLMKPGEHAQGKPRGERFKAILRDLQAMAAGEEVPPATPAVQTEAGSTQSKPRLSELGL